MDLKGQMIPAFPVVDVDDRESVMEKVIELPWITTRNIINDLGQTFAVIGNRIEGYYFAQLSSSVSIQRFYDALYKYQSQVSPNLKERYQYIAKITGDPALITYDRKAVTGIMVEIIAARAGDGEFFVDLQDTDKDTKFVGQEKINQFVPAEIDDDSTPA